MLSYLPVGVLDGRPYLSKVFSNAVETKANSFSNSDRFFMAKFTASHMNFFLKSVLVVCYLVYMRCEM